MSQEEARRFSITGLELRIEGDVDGVAASPTMACSRGVGKEAALGRLDG